MKAAKSFAALIIVFFGNALFAQNWQSLYGAGGTVGIYKLWGGDVDRSSLSYSGHIDGRYGISPFWMSGIDIGYGTFKPARFGTSTIADADSPYRTFLFPIDVTIRYTPLPQNIVKPYALGVLGMLFWDLAETGPRDGNVINNHGLRWGDSVYGTQFNFIAGFGAGFEWFISQRVALDFEFRGNAIINSKKDNVGQGDVNDKYYQFRVGAIYYVNKKTLTVQFREGDVISQVQTIDDDRPTAPPIEMPAPIVETPQPSPKQVEKPVEQPKMPEIGGQPLILRGVNFALGSAELTESAQRILEEVATSLRAHSEVRVRIEGHTDNTGPEILNRRLSLQRAESVKRFLVKHGVAADRLETVGRGPDLPIADNSTPEGQSLNRRIEFIRLE